MLTLSDCEVRAACFEQRAACPVREVISCNTDEGGRFCLEGTGLCVLCSPVKTSILLCKPFRQRMSHDHTALYVANFLLCRTLVIPVCWPDTHPDPRLSRKCSTVAWLGALPSSAGQELRATSGIDSCTSCFC